MCLYVNNLHETEKNKEVCNGSFVKHHSLLKAYFMKLSLNFGFQNQRKNMSNSKLSKEIT